MLYLFNIIISPFIWLWNNIIVQPIGSLGISVLGVFILLSLTSAAYRFIILPFTTNGFSMNPGIHISHNLSSLGRTMSYYDKAPKNVPQSAREWAQSQMSAEIGRRSNMNNPDKIDYSGKGSLFYKEYSHNKSYVQKG